MSEPDITESNKPCLVCGSMYFERDEEGVDRCFECETPMGESGGSVDWTLYVIVDGKGQLYDLRYGANSLTSLMASIRRSLRHGDVEVKVHQR